MRFQTKEALRQKANRFGEDTNEKGKAKRRQWKFEKQRRSEMGANDGGTR